MGKYDVPNTYITTNQNAVYLAPGPCHKHIRSCKELSSAVMVTFIQQLPISVLLL